MKKLMCLCLTLCMLLGFSSAYPVSAKTDDWITVPDPILESIYILPKGLENLQWGSGPSEGKRLRVYLWDMDELISDWRYKDDLNDFDYTKVQLFDWDVYAGWNPEKTSQYIIEPDLNKTYFDWTKGPAKLRASLKSDPSVYMDFYVGCTEYPDIQDDEPTKTFLEKIWDFIVMAWNTVIGFFRSIFIFS